MPATGDEDEDEEAVEVADDIHRQISAAAAALPSGVDALAPSAAAALATGGQRSVQRLSGRRQADGARGDGRIGRRGRVLRQRAAAREPAAGRAARGAPRVPSSRILAESGATNARRSPRWTRRWRRCRASMRRRPT